MKKFSFKRALVAGILCVATLFTIACGGTTGSGTTTTTGELKRDENGNIIFENIEIKMNTVVAGDDKQALFNIVQRFNREYDGKINVIITNTSAATYEDTVAKQIQNNSNPPDLIMSHQKAHKNFAENNLTQSLDEAMELSGIKLDMKNYAAGLARYSSMGYEGKTYSVPVDGQSQVVVYNKQLLAKYAEAAPTNRAELLEVCSKFVADPANAGNTPMAFATGADYFVNYVFLSALLQNGVKFFNDDYRVDWYSNEANRAGFTAAIASFRELFSKNYAKYNESSSTNLTQFIAGRRLFYFLDPWSLSNLVSKYAEEKGVNEAEVLENHLGGASIASWFAMSDNENKNAIYGDSHFFAMSRTVSDINVKAAILEFIKWFTTNASIGAQWATAGHFTASNLISSSDTYNNHPYVSTFISKFYPDINDFRCVGNTPYYLETLSNIQGIFIDTIGTDVTGSKPETPEKDAAAIKGRQDTVNNNIDFFG